MIGSKERLRTAYPAAKERSLIALTLAVCALLSGCGTTSLVSDPARKSISAVAISGNVAKPKQMFYLGPGDGGGLMFGAIGGALAAGPIERSRVAFQGFIEEKGISIEKIVREEVEAAVQRSGKLAVGPGGGTLSISIIQYGFGVPHLASSYVVPIVGFKCDIVDAGGKIVWSTSERLSTLGNPVEAVRPEAMRDDPALIERSWRTAARHLATNIINTF
jgi:hypothetical protein